MEEEVFGERPSEADDGAHLVYFMTPWGQIVWSYFTDEQWEMLTHVSSISNQPIESTLEEIVKERYEMMRRDFGLD